MSKELIVPQNTFAVLETANSLPTIDPELQKEMSKEDGEGFETATGFIPIVSIRQKDLIKADDKGKKKTIFEAGGFKMYDSVSAEMNQQIADVDDGGLTLTFLLDRTGRVFFEKLTDDKPKCRSNDGVIGNGTPGGDCAKCPLSQFHDNGTRPKCQQLINILVFDHALKACYLLRFGPSALKPYGSFKELIRRSGYPVHAAVVKVTTSFVAEPAAHYIPVFEIVNSLGGEYIDIFKEMKQFRGSLKGVFGRTVEVVEEEEPSNGDKPETVDTDYTEADAPC